MGQIVTEGEFEYLRFEEFSSPGYKTSIFTVCNQEGDLLGNVEWYSPWRRYCFAGLQRPPNATWFDSVYLKEIAAFMEWANERHKRKRKESRSKTRGSG